MSLFESASLVVTPNGTKASKLYAIKPTDGSGDLSVTRATTATRVNSAGLIESVAVNVPRLDYTNSSCPSILVEPQRTNLALQSSSFDNAAWTKFSSSVTANQITSPDGTQNADKLIALAVNSDHGVYQIPFVTLGASYTYSVFAKAGEYNFLRIADGDGNGAFFNLSNGTIVGSLSTNPTIISVGNGWYKCSMTALTSGTSTLMAVVVCQSGTTAVFTGDGTSGIYIYGAQLEAGAYATSYIPTTSASVTRNADVISKTGISSLIGQTEGTIFMDFIAPDGIAPIILNLATSNQTYLESIYLEYDPSLNSLSLRIWTNSALVGGVTKTSIIKGNRYKVAVSYKANDTAMYINGSLVAGLTQPNAIQSNLSEIYLGNLAGLTGNATFTGLIGKSTALWKTRLTNAELAELTTI